MANKEAYSLDEFRPHIRKIFNVEPHVFEAVCTTINNNKKYTQLELSKIINSWLKKEAK